MPVVARNLQDSVWGGGVYAVDGRDNAWRSRAPGPHAHAVRHVGDGLRTEVCGQQKQSNDPGNNQHNPQYANYWAPLMHKRHIPPHPAQPQHTNRWAPRTRKQHPQEHRPQRPTERSDPTQHAKGRTGDCPGPRKETATRHRGVSAFSKWWGPLMGSPAPLLGGWGAGQEWVGGFDGKAHTSAKGAWNFFPLYFPFCWSAGE